jgi:hypothetical protein
MGRFLKYSNPWKMAKTIYFRLSTVWYKYKICVGRRWMISSLYKYSHT